jgi:hypothetical protein
MSKRPSRHTLYTIGHSTRTARALVGILHAFGVTRLVDIRSIPWSRTNPQFNLDVLPATLHEAGISFVHLAALGGRRGRSKRPDTDANACWERAAFRNYADYADTAPFRSGLRELLEMASRETCAIMCAEAVWWRCHRRIVADHVLAHGVPVIHIFTRTKSEPASLTPFGVLGASARVHYPTSRSRQSIERARVDGRGDLGTDVAPPARMVDSTKATFRVGDHVSWNSEAGRVRGVITKKLIAPTKLEGRTVRASEEEPQYLIESDKTDHIAVHKGSALRKLKSLPPKARGSRSRKSRPD